MTVMMLIYCDSCEHLNHSPGVCECGCREQLDFVRGLKYQDRLMAMKLPYVMAEFHYLLCP